MVRSTSGPLITNAIVSKEASGRHKLSKYLFPASANLLILVNLPGSIIPYRILWYANMQLQLLDKLATDLQNNMHNPATNGLDRSENTFSDGQSSLPVSNNRKHSPNCLLKTNTCTEQARLNQGSQDRVLSQLTYSLSKQAESPGSMFFLR